MTSALGRLVNAARSYVNERPDVMVLQTPSPDRIGTYNMLRAYYHNNGLYQEIRQLAADQGVWHENIMALRNPANRVVEFYASHIWAGDIEQALEIKTDNDSILEPIHQVWAWSNFGVRKTILIRKNGTYGDMFMQVHENENGHVVFHLVDPRYVTDFDTDNSGNITYIRMDIPILVREGDSRSRKLWTEIWSKELSTFRTWVTDSIFLIPNELGIPREEISLEEMGIDFVPYVQFKFRDMDDEDGTAVGAFTDQIDKIDEVNRAATRLHEMLFRHDGVTWALEANMVDAAGRPMPAPRATRDTGVDGPNDSIYIGSDRFYRIPGNATLKAIVPDLNYAAALSIVEAAMNELENDLPELMWYHLTEFREVSGAAVQALMSPAIKRAEEVRGNMNHSLIRANMMALTIGMAAGMFPDLGTFDGGDLEHTFKPKDIIPLTRREIADTELANATAADSQIKVGVSRQTALGRIGFDYEAELDLREDEAEKEVKIAQLAMPPQPQVPPGSDPNNPNGPLNEDPNSPSNNPAARA